LVGAHPDGRWVQRIEDGMMSGNKIKVAAATALVLPLGILAAPAASAAITTPVAAAPVAHATGSVHICFPLGSFVWCI
jgi:hypothetical protein